MTDKNEGFVYKGMKYWEENGMYFKMQYGRKISVSRKDYLKFKEIVNGKRN